MPASRHQDHTLSPSANHVFVYDVARVHRIPAQRFMTIAKRPFIGPGRREALEMICPTAKGKYF
jgi:hypothetical protein